MKIIKSVTITVKAQFEDGTAHTAQSKIKQDEFEEAAFDPVVGDAFQDIVANIKRANEIQ